MSKESTPELTKWRITATDYLSGFEYPCTPDCKGCKGCYDRKDRAEGDILRYRPQEKLAEQIPLVLDNLADLLKRDQEHKLTEHHIILLSDATVHPLPESEEPYRSCALVSWLSRLLV